MLFRAWGNHGGNYLNRPRATEVPVGVVSAFVDLRELLTGNSLAMGIQLALNAAFQLGQFQRQFLVAGLINAIRELMRPPAYQETTDRIRKGLDRVMTTWRCWRDT